MLERFMNNSRQITIDLHGCSVADTKKILEGKLKKADLTNVTQLYIITGWGRHVNPGKERGVLKKILPKLLKPYQLELLSIQEEKGAYKIILRNAVKEEVSEHFLRNFAQSMGCQSQQDILNMLKEYEKASAQGNYKDSLLAALIHLHYDVGVYGNLQEGLKFLELARTQGALEACIFLGELYQEGLKVPPDNHKAFSYFKEAGEGGYSLGQYRTAICYLSGQGVRRNDKEGAMWMKKAADAGLPYAQHALADSYFKGDYTERDFKLSLEYTQRAAHQNFPAAQVELARHYATGFQGMGLLEQDYYKAFHYYWLAAQADDVFAMYQVGGYLSNGRLGIREPEQAFHWFLKCAKLDDADGQAMVAISYFRGEGVAQDIEASLFWCQKALRQDSDMAHWLMGQAYRDGKGVKQDTVKYIEHLTKATDKGYEVAKIELEKWHAAQPTFNQTKNYSLTDKTKIANTALIQLLNEKTALTFFGLCHQDYQVDAVAETVEAGAQEKAEDLQHQLGYGRFFTLENKKHFVLAGINLPEGNPSVGNRIQAYFK